MNKTSLSLGLAFLALAMVGCGSSTSTELAPDVKEPTTQNMSKDDILKMKQQGEVK
jgi:hypothetical protein